MRIAIQEDMLPGDSVLERLQRARDLGIDGVEFWAPGLTERVPEIAAALDSTDLKAAAVNAGRTQLLHPAYPEREGAIAFIRQAMADALDLGAVGVIFMPHDMTTPRLPDLRPYKHRLELEAEFLVTQLRATLLDLAYAMGAELYLAPANRYETHLIRRLDQAATIHRKLKDHPHLKFAADLFHMSLEEADIAETLRQHASRIGVVHLADSNRGLPGQGSIDFVAVIAALKEGGYDGWLTLACGTPGHNAENAPEFMRDLPATLEMLRKAVE